MERTLVDRNGVRRDGCRSRRGDAVTSTSCLGGAPDGALALRDVESGVALY